MKFIIIGLGNFGTSLAIKLTDMGHEVIGVDKQMEKVDEIKDKITMAFCLDCKYQEEVLLVSLLWPIKLSSIKFIPPLKIRYLEIFKLSVKEITLLSRI